MATLAVEPTARSTTTTTTSSANQPGSSEGPTMRVRDLLIKDLAGGAQPPSPDDGFYSAAYFDNVDEETFLDAQRAAFAEINDAALARAIQESEIYAAQRAAEETRRRTQAGSGGTSSAASHARSSTPAPTAPATPSPYALVSPSELGSQRSGGHSRRPSDAYVTPTPTAHAPSSSPPTTRYSPPLAQTTQSRSQYYAQAPASTSAYPSSTLSLSSSNSPPSSRVYATPTPNPTTYRPTMHDRQRSSSQSYYAHQNPQHQAKPMMTSPSHSRRASSSAAPATATAVHPSSYRQAAPPTSQPPPSTIDPATFYSNLSKTAPSSRKASVSSSMAPPTSSYSSSASRPRTMSSAASQPPSTAHNGAPGTQAHWYPTRSANSGGSSSSIPPPQPSTHSIPVPIAKPKDFPARARAFSTSNASTMSTTPTSSSMTARDLRMGMLASIPTSIPSRSPEVRTPANSSRPAQYSPPALAPPVRSPPVARPKRTRGKRVPTEIEKRAAKAKMFLTSNFGKECEKCGEEVEGPTGSPSIPSEPFSHNLLKHLHVICSNPQCGATYCRGCFESADEVCEPPASPSNPHSRTCRGGRGCDIKSCCTYGSVVALSHILDAFDVECVRAAQISGFGSPAASVRSAQAFIDLVISRGDKNTKAFEEVLIRALHAIESWLKVFEERREEYGDDEDDDEDVIDPSRHLLHPLITRSLLPSVFHAFLRNRNVGDWLKHSEVYLLIVEVLKRFVDNGLRKVLDEPIVALHPDEDEGSPTPFHWRFRARPGEPGGSTSESSSGAEDSHGSNSSGSDKDIETDATSPDEASDDDDESEEEKRRTWVAGGDLSARLKQGARPPRSIKALVTKLEEHRGPLMAFGANVRFPATKVKVNCLCDGISYLLLQQVVAWD